MGHGRARGQAGITLPELLVVIAIIGLIAVIAIPNFTTFWRSYKASMAVNEMIQDMNLARQLAISRRQPYNVQLQASPANTWTATNTVTSQVARQGELPEGVTMSVVVATAPLTWGFQPNGSCTSPTTLVGTTPSNNYVRVDATITASRTERYTIEVSPAGRIKSTKTVLP